MYDNTNLQLISYRYGEQKPLIGTLSVPSGTQTVTNPTFTLVDDTGLIVLNAVTATASAPGLTVQVSYNLDSSVLQPSKWYYAYFSAGDTPSDGVARVEQPTFAIWIAPIVEATCVLTTDIGKVRLLISDTNITDPIFSDPEIETFMTLGGSSLHMAAYYALMSMASDRARMAISMNSGGWGTTQSAVYSAIMAVAATFPRMGVRKVFVPASTPRFTLTNPGSDTVGSMEGW